MIGEPNIIATRADIENTQGTRRHTEFMDALKGSTVALSAPADSGAMLSVGATSRVVAGGALSAPADSGATLNQRPTDTLNETSTPEANSASGVTLAFTETADDKNARRFGFALKELTASAAPAS